MKRGFIALCVAAALNGVQDAGKCMNRMSPGRIYADYHPSAPEGFSLCDVCGRFVVRGQGRWWER